jgi:hypothetical protein
MHGIICLGGLGFIIICNTLFKSIRLIEGQRSMSEKQGGQHEIGSKPVQAACKFCGSNFAKKNLI